MLKINRFIPLGKRKKKKKPGVYYTDLIGSNLFDYESSTFIGSMKTQNAVIVTGKNLVVLIPFPTNYMSFLVL